MPYEQRELSGSLFKNNRKEKDTHPNSQGSCLIDGVESMIPRYIEAMCEQAIGLNQMWSRVNAEALRDLALRGLASPSATDHDAGRQAGQSSLSAAPSKEGHAAGLAAPASPPASERPEWVPEEVMETAERMMRDHQVYGNSTWAELLMARFILSLPAAPPVGAWVPESAVTWASSIVMSPYAKPGAVAAAEIILKLSAAQPAEKGKT